MASVVGATIVFHNSALAAPTSGVLLLSSVLFPIRQSALMASAFEMFLSKTRSENHSTGRDHGDNGLVCFGIWLPEKAGDYGHPPWAGLKPYGGTTNALDCADPGFHVSVAKKNKEEIDMKASTSKTQSSGSGGDEGRSCKDERTEEPDDGAVAGGGGRRLYARTHGPAPKAE